MSDEGASPSARMTAALEKLHASAKQNKSVRDELSRSVIALERAVGRLDLRVASYCLISKREGPDGDQFHREYVGYIEHEGRWQIVVSTDDGFESRPDEVVEKIWSFDKAPQFLRAKAIDRLPDLIESLATTVDNTTERLRKRVDPARELTTAVNSASKRKKETP